MRKYAILNKKVGETPLEALRAFIATDETYGGVPASYAGRLDPMASGKLLVLFGDECKRQGKYTGLDKEYEIEVLLDVGSDTGDALGIVTGSSSDTRPSESILNDVLAREVGKHMRPYPAYSSKTVNGKPLFLHALEGTLKDREIPMHEEHIYRITLLGTEKVSAPALKARIDAFLALAPTSDEPSKALGADFRITDVRASWDVVLANTARSYVVVRLRVTCASGTYMRALAGRIGEAFSTNGLALSIHRTHIGRYVRLFDRHGFWLKNLA